MNYSLISVIKIIYELFNCYLFIALFDSWAEIAGCFETITR